MPKHRLLLADDSVTIQKVVNLTFADEGIEVITAGDGNTAMEKFVESTPDLVMVDVNMPGFDGYRICEMIKQDEETRRIPVILLVGSFEPFDEAEARRVGADDYLTKPFQSIRQLVTKVSDLLNHSNGESSSANKNNFALPIAQASPTADVFADVSATNNETNFEKFDDAGADDEMIQTNQIGSLPADEMQKFIFEPNQQKANDDFADSGSFENKEDAAEIQLFDREDFPPINSIDAEISPNDEKVKIYELADEQPFALETAPDVAEQSIFQTTDDDKNMMSETNFDQAPVLQNDSIFDFDDLNFLEIPPLAKKPIPKATPEAAENTTENFVAQPVAVDVEPEKAEENAGAAQTTGFSPEVIEAIAKKVIAELSERVVKEMAREITPQMTESIIREMARQKSN